jgi:glycogen debranching enzyme
MQETFYYTMRENNSYDTNLYRIKKGSCLRLKCDGKLLSEDVRVFCNYPKDKKTAFERSKFYQYEWTRSPNQLENDDFDKFIDIELSNAGTFQVYFTINAAGPCPNGSMNIIVEPELKRVDGTHVSLDCLQVQTVLTKLLGPLNEWESRLITAKNTGYNMLHFTPVEELSKVSDSSYSLRDHTKLNSDVSHNGLFTFDDLSLEINRIYTDWNMFSICDLVYNHVSTCSPFLQNVPNAAYNLENSAFLRPAYLLDRILFYLSKDIENGKYQTIGIMSTEFNERNLEQIRVLLKNDLLPRYKLEEFFQVDCARIISKIQMILQEKMKNNNFQNHQRNSTELWSKLKIVQDSRYKRLGSTLDFELVEAIIDAELGSSSNPAYLSHQVDTLTFHFKQRLECLNDDKRNTVASWLDDAMKNCCLNAKYHFFAHDGPKYKRITTNDTPFVPRYFYDPLSSETSVESDEIQMEANSKFIMAHNGWVLDHDPLVNFCAEDSFIFIKRELIPWVDSVKLRYGKNPVDCPELWQYMGK